MGLALANAKTGREVPLTPEHIGAYLEHLQ